MPTRKATPRKPTLFESDLAHMEAELGWVEARCRRIALEEKQRSTSGRRRHRWNDDDDLPPNVLRARIKSLRAKENKLRKDLDARLDAHLAAHQPVALDRLCGAYGLDPFERNTLLLAVAPCFSSRFSDLFDEVLAESGYGSGCCVELAFAFSGLGFADRVLHRDRFAPTAPLLSNDLIRVDLRDRYRCPEDLLTATLAANARTFAHLVGRAGLDDAFLEFSSLQEPLARFDQVVLPDDDRQRILAAVAHHDRVLEVRKSWGLDDLIRYGKGQLLLFHGEPGTGKTMTAHAIAHAQGKRVLLVDLPTFVGHHDAGQFLPGLFREARLQNALLFFDECELLFEDRRKGNALMTLLLTEVERFEGIAVLATNLPGSLDPALERRILTRVAFERPDVQAREAIWREHIPVDAPIVGALDLAELASRYELTGGLIKNAVLAATATAVRDEPDSPALSQALLDTAAREQLVRVSNAAGKQLRPKARLSDLVLPEAALSQVHEIVAAARSWRLVIDRWGVGSHLTSGKGLAALFHGPPGTGKTLCAEAIAGELGRPLITASLPSLLSKWLGGTEQNLQALFDRATSTNAVLLLDEVDSVATERGHSQRHDDRVVNTLLQLLDRHAGLVLLATNLPGQLDGALGRRLIWTLAFAAPDAVARERIWAGLLPEDLVDTIDLRRLARHELTGGLIRNAVFKSAFRAASHDRALDTELLDAAAAEQVPLCTRRTAGFIASA